MKLGTLSADELRELRGRIEKELEVRERIRVETEFIKQRMRALEEIAREHGIVSFDDLPDGLSLPGQVVEFAGKAYKNVASLEISTPPNMPVNVWARVIEEEQLVEEIVEPIEEPLPIEEPPVADVIPVEDEPVVVEPSPEPEPEITPEPVLDPEPKPLPEAAPEPEIPVEETPITVKEDSAPVKDEVTEPEIVDTV